MGRWPSGRWQKSVKLSGKPQREFESHLALQFFDNQIQMKAGLAQWSEREAEITAHIAAMR